jgi:hypothetical protein
MSRINLFLCLFLLITSPLVEAASCMLAGVEILGSEVVEMVEALGAGIKADFKKRKPPISTYKPLIKITSNFTVPLVGSDNYFGNIYLVKGKPGIVKYRDELIADRRYSEEKQDNSFYTSEYKVSEINSPAGLVLIKKAGAEVRLTSTNFSTTTGGSLKLNVKGPGDKIKSLQLEIVITNGVAKNYLIVGGTKHPFDTMNITAEKSFFGGRSILSGIESVQFTSNGQLSKSINIEDQ